MVNPKFEFRNPKTEFKPLLLFWLGHWEFFRHWSFVLRHSPSLRLALF